MIQKNLISGFKVIRVVTILTLILIPVVVFAKGKEVSKQMNNTAPELVLKEKDFDFLAYEDSLMKLNKYFNEWWAQENHSESAQTVVLKVDWAMLNIGVRNHLLVLKGYGLMSQREILSLKLENAKLKKVSKETIVGLERRLREIDEQIKSFLSNNYWTD